METYASELVLLAPVDKLTHVPEPVIALLEILLEKDPDRRLQTPTELLRVIPKVTEALEALEALSGEILKTVAELFKKRSKQTHARSYLALGGNKFTSAPIPNHTAR